MKDEKDRSLIHPSSTRRASRAAMVMGARSCARAASASLLEGCGVMGQGEEHSRFREGGGPRPDPFPHDAALSRCGNAARRRTIS